MAAVGKTVLLGLRDAAVRGRPKGPGAWTASKLGGVPDALPAVAAPRPVCELCRQPLVLVVQVYCPLEGSPFHRLVLFACPRPGWKVFRSQCLQMRETETQDAQKVKGWVAEAKGIGEITQVCLNLIHWIFFQKEENGLTAENWCEGADDWGSDSEEAPSSQLTLDFGNDSSSAKEKDWTAQLQDLCLQDAVRGAAPPVPPGEGVALPPGLPQFPPYYICVVDEDDYRDSFSLDHAHSLLRDYQQREGIDMKQLLSPSLSGDGDEKYEKTVIKSGDKVFYKFMKRIAVCQEQILRRESSWRAQSSSQSPITPAASAFTAPLLSLDAVGANYWTCSSCLRLLPCDMSCSDLPHVLLPRASHPHPLPSSAPSASQEGGPFSVLDIVPPVYLSSVPFLHLVFVLSAASFLLPFDSSVNVLPPAVYTPAVCLIDEETGY
ncbi:programmed cell death 2-like protein [Camelus ferus]|nr:programmed cell death 2-like protein [Camelus ferus]